MESITCIESALEPFENELPANNIDTLFVSVKEKMNIVIGYNQKEQHVNLEDQILKEILSTFFNWKEEIEKTLKPYIVS